MKRCESGAVSDYNDLDGSRWSAVNGTCVCGGQNQLQYQVMQPKAWRQNACVVAREMDGITKIHENVMLRK